MAAFGACILVVIVVVVVAAAESSELIHFLPVEEKVKYDCIQGVSGVHCATAGCRVGFWN